MIIARNLSKSVATQEGDLHILTDVSFSVAAGESVAIIGASGSGKTTLLSVLAGLDLPSSGEVSLNGRPLSGTNEDQRAAIRADCVGFVFQSFQLLPSLTALENVMLPAELKQMPNPEALARQYLDRVGLEPRLSHYPRQLSGGEQQRVAIARAFAAEAPILFADEPTGNLDTHTGARVIELLFELNKEQGRTLILVTHEQRLAERCERVLELSAGKLVSDSRSSSPATSSSAGSAE